MFSLSTTTTYALRAMSSLEGPDGAYRGTVALAETSRVPGPYLAKVMNLLAQAGLVEGRRGPQGGFRLARHGGEISVWDILMATEGNSWNRGCALGLDACRVHAPCPFHACAQEARQCMEQAFRASTLVDMAPRRNCHDGVTAVY